MDSQHFLHPKDRSGSSSPATALAPLAEPEDDAEDDGDAVVR